MFHPHQNFIPSIYLFIYLFAFRDLVIHTAGVLKNIVKFAGKHLCRNFFLNKVVGWKNTKSSNRDSGKGVFL